MDYAKNVAVGFTVAILPLFLIALCILAFCLVPFLFIWAANLLFETQIEFNFWNSVAIYVLLGLFNGGFVSSRKE